MSLHQKFTIKFMHNLYHHLHNFKLQPKT